MIPLLAGLAAMTVLAGVWLIAAGARPAPIATGRPRRPPSWRQLAGARRTRLLVTAGAIVGVIGFAVTGWVVVLVVAPLAAVGVPYVLSPSTGPASIARLEAMEEWTRSLSGVLTVGVGLEQALIATLRSTPEPIRPEVSALVSRLRARWNTEAALRAFADDLDDATGDLIASSLLLGAARRGTGLASVLEGLAASVADDVKVRRQIETDRSKPRSTARWVTLITLVVLALLAINGDYIAPYGTAVGQLLLTLLLAGYAGALLWMRQLAQGKPLPRFVGNTIAATTKPTPDVVAVTR